MKKIRFEGTENIFSLIGNWGPVTSCLLFACNQIRPVQTGPTLSSNSGNFRMKLKKILKIFS